MSTKIYSGYRLPQMDMADLLVFCKDLQQKFKEAKLMSIRTLFPDDKKYRESWIKLQESIWDANRKKISHPLDYTSEIVFFPDPKGSQILAITYWDQRELTKVWDSLEQVKFYGYWNNVDPDEDATEEEWKQREEAWNRVLLDDPLGIPSQNGFTFTLLDCNLPFPEQLGKIN